MAIAMERTYHDLNFPQTENSNNLNECAQHYLNLAKLSRFSACVIEIQTKIRRKRIIRHLRSFHA